ncbi:unnamed protein product, partial [Porites lobata]
MSCSLRLAGNPYIVGAYIRLYSFLVATHEEWGYADTNNDVLGPPDWKDRYEDCGHRKQSPINIVKSETIKKSFSPLKITFDNAKGLVTGTFKNTGHLPELEIADSNGASLTKGPLGHKTFELLQFHVHFGCANDRGSEHTLDEKRFSGE